MNPKTFCCMDPCNSTCRATTIRLFIDIVLNL